MLGGAARCDRTADLPASLAEGLAKTRMATERRGPEMDSIHSRICTASLARREAFAVLVAWLLGTCPAFADPIGQVTKLPLPRFASLKTDRVNLREGPSKDHATKWVYERAGLPVEIIAEFEIWRRVRDSEGVEGWVLHSLLSGRRTALVTPNKKGQNSPIYRRPSESSDLAATLQAGVIVNIRSCDGTWCLVDGEGFKGHIQQVKLWGVYPNEKIE